MSRETQRGAGEASREERAYWAFLSYSHRDQEWGAWFHRRLETWKVPAGLAGRLTPTSRPARHLYPIFRDREELPTSADLGGSIRRALSASRHLIVVCSPAAAASHWVNEEVLAFQALGRQDRILCVIVAGEPNASGKAGFRPEEECFCPALRVRVGPDGRPTGEPNEPIAADVRPGGDSRRGALLKLCAGVLGVDFARLADRVRRRRRARILSWAAVLLVLLGAAAFFVEKDARDRESERAGFRADARTQARLAAARASAEHGDRAADEGRPREALTWFAEALEQDPALAGAAERLASVLAHVGFPLPVAEEPGPFARRKAFAPADGSAEFLGADEEGRLRRFDARSGEPTSEPLQEGEVDDWALASGGTRLAVITQIVHGSGGARFASNLRWLAVYDLRTGRPLAPPAKTYFSRVVATPTGTTLVFGVEQGSAGEGHVERWDAERGVRVGEPFELEKVARAIALDPSGTRVAVAAMDGRVRVREVGTWALVGEPFLGGDDAETVAWSGDGRSLAAGFHDGTARTWDVATGALRTAPLPHGAPLTAVALSPDGRRLATVAGWSATRLWDATDGTLLAGPLGAGGEYATVAFSPDGAHLLVVARDGAARVLDARTGRPACETLEVAGGIARAAWEGDRVRTVSVAGTAHVWEVRGRAAAPLALSHDGDVLDFDVSEDGKRIATGSADGTARVWDAASGGMLTKVAPGASVREVAFRYEGERLRTSTEWGAQQWNARTGAPLEGQGTESGVSSLDASTWFRRTDDGNAWVKVSDWRRVEFFPRGHAKDAEPPAVTLPSRVTEVAFGAGDTRVAIGTAEGTVHVFEMGTSRACGRTIVHAAEVTGVAFAPAGGAPRLATASRDGTARLWDVDTGRPRGEPLRHPGPVVSLAFLPDGRLLTAAGHAAHLWDVEDLPVPVPAWLPAFARSVARRRVAQRGGTLETPGNPLTLLAEQRALVGTASATDPWARLAAWFTTDGATRTRAPLTR